MVAQIVGKRMHSDAKYLIIGDMNDGINVQTMMSILYNYKQLFFGLLECPDEYSLAEMDEDGLVANTKVWTHIYKKKVAFRISII